MDALAAGHDAAAQMIDTSVVRVRFMRSLTPMVCRSTSPLRRVRRMTIGCVRSFSAPCFHERCCSRIDADWIRELARQQGAWANIPPKRNRKDPICFSPYLYRASNLIERFFNKIKQCRRVATEATNSRPTTWPSSNSHQYGFGFALMSPRPSY